MFTAYWDSKREADDDLRNSGLEWTIIKPARLTDDAPTDMVRTSINDEPNGDKSVSRADVAGFTTNLILSGELATGEIDLFTVEG
ncbi:SDR family oxidoreductase [Corynebacterium sp. CCM 8862]|uniref:SDR family oxidoreductase n=1 Tax=Corynebacterium mendelii TaxID=2765362 RepID=A0A939IYL7_9CORY|nr:SDR family oxidoreductase [Corynebacterium mendelii]